MRTGTGTPYETARAALVQSDAVLLRTFRPKAATTGTASELEFWLMPHAAHQGGTSRIVILQHWLESGGFDYYIQGAKHKTDEAIAEILSA